MGEHEYGHFPLRAFLGMDIEESRPGEAVARIDVDEAVLNPNGVVHGGVLFTMVDTAMGKATMSVLDASQLCASVELHMRFLRPAGGEILEAVATVVRRGGRIVHLESRVHDGEGNLVATGAGTFAVIEDPQA